MNLDSTNRPDENPNQDDRELNSSDRTQLDRLVELLVEPEEDSASLASGSAVESELDSSDLESVSSDGTHSQPESTDSKIEEIDVAIQSQPQPTLSEAVEYEAFLRQTINSDSNNDSESTALENTAPINSIEEVEAINTERAAAEELADAVNSLIPLIVSLLEFKLDNSREGIVATVRPILDRLIEERTAEDSPKMASAIARLLPAAIEDEIRLNPQAIAKAIAPEIAMSIREQILLDKDAIPETLGPEMGQAIKAQIESEKDAMVDALYPVIGSTISKYMVEVVQDINAKVESTLSPEGIRRKFQARMQGVSEAELIFKESIGYRVRAIFLIHKDSGLVIQEIQLPGQEHLDSDMLAGMLTAIRSFANECIVSGSELDSIDYGDWQIPIEVGGYCYLAAIVAGEPPKEFITRIRQVLGEIILEHDEMIQNFAGDPAIVPVSVKSKLEELTETTVEPTKKQRTSPVLLWLIIFLLSLIIFPWSITSYRGRIADRVEQLTATQLDAAPELSVYRLEPTVERRTLTVDGRVPSSYLRDRVGSIVRDIAQQNNLAADNQVIAVDVPPDPDSVRGEIARLRELFDRQPQVAMGTSYRDGTLTIKGLVLEPEMRQQISDAFNRIPGVAQIVFELNSQIPPVKQQIFFKSGSSKLNFSDNFSKINAVREVLQQYPQLRLKLIAHSDNVGSTAINQALSRERCQNVKTALVVRGIEANRLTTNCNSPILPKNNDNNKSIWSRRYVSFEPFISANQ